MSNLADDVLPLIRTRADLLRYGRANAHGVQMHEAVDILEAAAETEEPATVLAVTQRAIGSACTVIMRADDSSGIIGDACRRLLRLHPQVAARARSSASKLVDWMVTFQFDNTCDFFELDPVAYAPALGEKGVAAYRAKLDGIAADLGPRPADGDAWSSPHSHEWFTLDWNARRLAVLDHDVEAIIRTHARDRRVARWLHDTAQAFEEIGEHDLERPGEGVREGGSARGAAAAAGAGRERADPRRCEELPDCRAEAGEDAQTGCRDGAGR